MKAARPKQLSFVFADSPKGSKGAGAADESKARAYLLHIAKGMSEADLAASESNASELMEHVASSSNLAAALLNVARNKGAPGVDGRSVGEVVEAAPRLLTKLRRALLDGSYQPGDIRRVWIPKPGGGQRGLGIPNVIDRWVQHAVLQVLEPIFEPVFHRSSHGFRPHRGAHTAIAEATQYLAAGDAWVVDIDLAKFAAARADQEAAQSEGRASGRHASDDGGRDAARRAAFPALVEHRAR
jgi:RNA-directed DNA polymerase